MKKKKNNIDEIIAGIAVSMAIENKPLDAHLRERLRQFLTPVKEEKKTVPSI